jgi:hypothetical protein
VHHAANFDATGLAVSWKLTDSIIFKMSAETEIELHLKSTKTR